MRLSFRFFIPIPILLIIAKSTFAIKFEHLVVFGDSYSDNGNGVYKVSNGSFPPPPYFEGRLSNGPVWVEYLSKKLDTTLIDKAAGGATTSSMFVPSAAGINDEITVHGIRQQINEFINDEHVSEFSVSGDKKHLKSNLFVVAPFGIDYIYTIRHGPKVVSPEQVMGQIITNLQTLIIELRAENFMVTTIPNFSNFPGFSKSNSSEIALLTNLIEDHNQLLRKSLAVLKLDFKKAKIFLLDIDKFFQKLDSKRFKESCFTIDHNGPHVCDDPDKFLFWDNLHVTTRIHEMLALEAFACTEKFPSRSTPFKVC